MINKSKFSFIIFSLGFLYLVGNLKAETPSTFNQELYNKKFREEILSRIKKGQSVSSDTLVEIAKKLSGDTTTTLDISENSSLSFVEVHSTPITKLGFEPISTQEGESINLEAEKKGVFGRMFSSRKKASAGDLPSNPYGFTENTQVAAFNDLVANTSVNSSKGIRGSRLYQEGLSADQSIAKLNNDSFRDAASSTILPLLDQDMKQEISRLRSYLENHRSKIAEISESIANNTKATNHQSMLENLKNLEANLEVIKKQIADTEYKLPARLESLEPRISNSGLLKQIKDDFQSSKSLLDREAETIKQSIASTSAAVVQARDHQQIDSGAAPKAQPVADDATVVGAQSNGVTAAQAHKNTKLKEIKIVSEKKEEKPIESILSPEEQREQAAQFMSSVGIGLGLATTVSLAYANRKLIIAKIKEYKRKKQILKSQASRSNSELEGLDKIRAEIDDLQLELYDSEKAIIAAENDLGLELNRLLKTDEIVKGGSLEGREKLKNNIARLAKWARDLGEANNIQVLKAAGENLEKLLRTRYVSPHPFEGNPLSVEFSKLQQEIEQSLAAIDSERAKMEDDILKMRKEKNPEAEKLKAQISDIERKLNFNSKLKALSQESLLLKNKLQKLDNELLLTKALDFAQVLWIGERGQQQKVDNGAVSYKSRISELTAQRENTRIQFMEALDRDRVEHRKLLNNKKAELLAQQKLLDDKVKARQNEFFTDRNQRLTELEGEPIKNKPNPVELEKAKADRGQLPMTKKRVEFREAIKANDESISTVNKILAHLREQQRQLIRLNLPEDTELSKHIDEAEQDIVELNKRRDQLITNSQKYIELPGVEGANNRAYEVLEEAKEIRTRAETLEFHLRRQAAAVETKLKHTYSQSNLLRAKLKLKEAQLAEAEARAKLIDPNLSISLKGNDIQLDDLRRDLRIKEDSYQSALDRYNASKFSLISENPGLQKIDSRRGDLAASIPRLQNSIEKVNLELNAANGDESKIKILKAKKASLEKTLAINQANVETLNREETKILRRGQLQRYRDHQEDEKVMRRERVAREVAREKLEDFQKRHLTTESLSLNVREKEVLRRQAEDVLAKYQREFDITADAERRANEALSELSPERVDQSTASSPVRRGSSLSSKSDEKVDACLKALRAFARKSLTLTTKAALY